MNTQSLVTWNYTLADQQGYLLERSTNSGSVWSTLLSCSLATTSYYDTDLWWGSSLWYRVAAINGFGRGPRSSTAYVYINYPGIDTPILSGSQVAAFQTASALSWSYSGSAIGSAVSFSLERSTNGGSTWTQVWAVSPTGSAFIDNPLAYATTASYRIRAACDFGLNGPYSNIATVLLYPSNDIPELDWITAFQNYAYAPTSSVSWSYSGDPSMAEGVVIERAWRQDPTHNLTYTNFLTVPNLITTSYQDTAVTYSREYFYRAYAYSGSNTSSYTDITSSFIQAFPPQLQVWQHGTESKAIAFWGNYLGQYSMSLSRSSDGGSSWDVMTVISPLTGGYYYEDYDVSVGNTYIYKVQEVYRPGQPESITASVTIAAADPSRIAFGYTADQGYQNNEAADTQWEYHTMSLLNINYVARKDHKINRWLFGGDNLYQSNNFHGGYDGQNGRLLGPSSSFHAVLGNHDISDAGVINYRNYFNPWTTSYDSGSVTGIQTYRYYTASYQTVDIWFLEETSDSGTNLFTGQRQWFWFSQSLSHSMTKPDVKWRMALVHVPGITSLGSGHSGNPSLIDLPWKEWGIDAMFAGHVHWAERMESSSVLFVNSSIMGSDKRTPVPTSSYTKWWYAGGEEDDDYVWTLLEFESGSNRYAFSMSFYSGSTLLDDSGSTSIPNAAMVGGRFILMKPWFAPPTASAAQSGDPEAYISWTFDGDFSQSLYRSANSGSTWPVTYSINPGVRDYTDSTVSSNTSYWYKVKHMRWPTEPFSNVAEVYISTSVVPPEPPPEAPIFLMVTSGSAILDWTSGSNNTAYYDIYKSVNSEAGPYTYLTSSVTTHHRDFDVNKNNTYYYKVAAVNNGGSSSFSNIADLTILPCSVVDFYPVVYNGYINHGSGSIYRNTYGTLLPFTTSVSQSISVWGRSKDFDVYLALVDANGNVLAENNGDGWTPSGDTGNAALTYNLSSGSYQIEVSSVDNKVGRYLVYVSPGPRLETTWSIGMECGVAWISSSRCMLAYDQGGKNVVWYDYVNNQVITSSYYNNGTQGAVYSPRQDKVYVWAYYQTNGVYSASIDVYDNTGSFINSNFYTDRYLGNGSTVSQSGNIVHMVTTTGLPDFTTPIFQEGPTVEVGDRIAFQNNPFPSSTVTAILGPYDLQVSESRELAAQGFNVNKLNTAYLDGYLSYDEHNDRILLSDYNYNNFQQVSIFDCATENIITSSLVASYTNFADLWMNDYSPVDNSYYLATTTYQPTIKIDASTFAITKSIAAEIVINHLSGSELMIIRGAGDKVAFFSPTSQSLVHTQSDMPSSGLFEGGGSGDLCSNTYVATLDSDMGPNVASIALIDRSTFLPVNFLPLCSDSTGDFPDGWFQYGIAFNPDDSRIYVSMHSYDDMTGRLYSVRASRAGNPIWLVPYTSSAADTASCVTYDGYFQITSSTPTTWMERAYPEYVATNGYSMMVSDFAYYLDDFMTHNRHNWFFDLQGNRLNDYTSSYTHVFQGRNAVVANEKYYVLSNGLNSATFLGEPITASSVLVFDTSGSLVTTIPTTFGAMDIGTDGGIVYVFEHNGTDVYIDQITASNDIVTGTDAVQNMDWGTFLQFDAQISETASLNDYSLGYNQGKMFVARGSNGDALIYANNLQTGSEAGCGWGDVINRIYGFGIYYNYSLNMADGTSPYGGWAGSLAYCPLNNHVYVGAYSAAPDYAPTILECDITLDVVKTWDLSELTASDLYSIDDIVWNAKDRTLNAWSYGGNDGFMTILDPMANTVVCQKNVIAGESPMGGSAGHVIAANPRNGYIYIPQRMDGDAGSSLTGSIKIYRP